MNTEFSYFSIAVKNIGEATDLYAKMLGLEIIEPPEESHEFGFVASRLGINGTGFIELLEPIDEKSAVSRFIETRGEGVYMISLEVDDLRETVKQVRSSGGRITGLDEGEEPSEDTLSVWIHPMSSKGVFIELRQSDKTSLK